MSEIWKFRLDPNNSPVDVPEGAKVLSAGVQGDDDIFIWAEVETTKPTEVRHFEVYGTGHTIADPVNTTRTFIDTVQMYGGSLIFHVFERKSA